MPGCEGRATRPTTSERRQPAEWVPAEWVPAAATAWRWISGQQAPQQWESAAAATAANAATVRRIRTTATTHDATTNDATAANDASAANDAPATAADGTVCNGPATRVRAAVGYVTWRGGEYR